MFAATAAILAACTPKTAPELPLETFFRNTEKTGYQISPDGKYFSYMAPYESRRNIFVQPVDGKDAVRITSETERDLAGYFWANNNRILYLKDTGGDENFQLYGVDIDGSNPKAYTAIPGVRTQIIDPLEEIDSLMIIGTNQRNPMIFDPYRLNLNTGEMTMLCENPGDIQGWQTDHDGKLRVAYAIVDGVNTQIRYRETEAEPFRPVLTTNFKEGVSFATFTPDNKLVYAITNLGRDKSALVLMDPATCEELEQLYTNDKYDLRGIWYSDAQKKIAGCFVRRPQRREAPFLRQGDGRDVRPHGETPARLRSRHQRLEQGRRQIYRLCGRRPHDGRLLPLRRESRHDDQTGRPRTLDRGAADGRDDTGYLYLARRPRNRGLPHAARRQNASQRQEPARSGQSAWRPVGPRLVGIQPRGAVPRQPRLRRTADELPRFDRLRTQIHRNRLRQVGPDHAGRHYGRRELADRKKASPIPRRSPSTAAATAVTPRCRVSSRIPTSMPAPWTTWAYRTSSRSCKPSLPTGNRCST